MSEKNSPQSVHPIWETVSDKLIFCRNEDTNEQTFFRNLAIFDYFHVSFAVKSCVC